MRLGSGRPYECSARNIVPLDQDLECGCRACAHSLDALELRLWTNNIYLRASCAMHIIA
jgi:hypothetical protein